MLKITTNNHWRHFVYAWDVPLAVLLDQFDYLSGDDELLQKARDAFAAGDHAAAREAFDNASQDWGGGDGYFRYHGHWYHTSGFMRCYRPGDRTDGAFEGWDGSAGDSFFSGTLIQLHEDGETYRVGTYCVVSDTPPAPLPGVPPHIQQLVAVKAAAERRNS